MSDVKLSNQAIADILDQIGALLEAKDANPFRVQAYRNAAATARQLDRSLAEIVGGGDEQALRDLPNIGQGIANTIQEIVKTGSSSQLRDLQSEVDPIKVLTEVPGIGDELANRVVDELGIESLEALEVAAHDGRLAQVEGFGEGRIESVKVSLAGMLSPAAQRRARQAVSGAEPVDEPPVEMLLDVDREYRERASAGKLRTIAPKRFNPGDESWLPIMNTDEGPWSFTALFSNTKRAHDLGKTDDWLVIYYERDGQEDQCTVVTETDGPMAGLRVIRGREMACRQYYEDQGRL
ncbi:MAG: helix-hairpin-helix domain-containing protein [Anaerolineales bacterium]